MLIGSKIPYVIAGGSGFYERKEVRDVLAYVRVATRRNNAKDNVKRCLNAPFRISARRSSIGFWSHGPTTRTLPRLFATLLRRLASSADSSPVRSSGLR